MVSVKRITSFNCGPREESSTLYQKENIETTKDTIVGYKHNIAGKAQRRRKPKSPRKAQKSGEKLQSDFIAIGIEKFATIRKKGTALFLNIPQYKRDAKDKLLTTKRGIMLTIAE